jgi:proline racemase
MTRVKTIDAHAAGEPLRLIVDGFPTPRGRTMLEKREWVRRHADHVRRALMLEPRGHADMYGAILTEPVSPGAHAGILFMHNEGFSTMCGHGVIAVTTIALERALLVPGGDGVTIVYDSPAGIVRARAKIRAERVESVAFQNVASFVLHGGLTVALASRTVRVDVAFGGAFYAIVDSEAVGLPIDVAHLADLRRVGMEIKRAIEASQAVTHPLEPGLKGVYGTIFTGPPNDPSAHLRNVTIFADAEVDRSPCGTGTAAVMAVLDAMGLLGDDARFVHESLIGTTFTGRIAGRTKVGEHEAIIPEIEGSAWITGEHTFVVDDEDPLRNGFRV